MLNDYKYAHTMSHEVNTRAYYYVHLLLYLHTPTYIHTAYIYVPIHVEDTEAAHASRVHMHVLIHSNLIKLCITNIHITVIEYITLKDV